MPHFPRCLLVLAVGLLATGRYAMAQADPGLVVVAEGDLARVAFEVPGYYTPYRLNYNAGGPRDRRPPPPTSAR